MGNNVSDQDRGQHFSSNVADSVQTVASVTLHTKALPTLQGLPVELRVEIFSYLLDGDLVRTAPYHARYPSSRTLQIGDREANPAHTYTFQTNIMGVNHAIYEEAKGVLLSRNHFVIVSYHWLALSQCMHILGVPIITDDPDTIARFKYPVVDIRIAHREEGDSRPLPRRREEGGRHILMLAQDLDTLALAVRWISLYEFHTAAVVTKCHGCMKYKTLGLITDAESRPRYCTTVSYKNAKNTTDTMAYCIRTYQALTQLRIPNQRVRIHIPTTERIILLFKKFMGPSEIYLTAALQDLLFMVQKYVKTANALVVAGEYLLAEQHFRVISDAVIDSYTLSMARTRLLTEDTIVPLVLLHRIVLDAAVMHGLIRLRLHKRLEYVWSLCLEIVGFISSFANHDQILGFTATDQVAHWWKRSGVQHFVHLAIIDNVAEWASEDGLCDIVQAIKDEPEEYHREIFYAGYDAKALPAAFSSMSRPCTSKQLAQHLLNESSARKLPLPTYEFVVPPQTTPVPRAIGWKCPQQREERLRLDEERRGQAQARTDAR